MGGQSQHIDESVLRVRLSKVQIEFQDVVGSVVIDIG